LFLVVGVLCAAVLICRVVALNLLHLLLKDCRTQTVGGNGLGILNLRRIVYE